MRGRVGVLVIPVEAVVRAAGCRCVGAASFVGGKRRRGRGCPRLFDEKRMSIRTEVRECC